MSCQGISFPLDGGRVGESVPSRAESRPARRSGFEATAPFPRLSFSIASHVVWRRSDQSLIHPQKMRWAGKAGEGGWLEGIRPINVACPGPLFAPAVAPVHLMLRSL